MLPDIRDYDRLVAAFRWRDPRALQYRRRYLRSLGGGGARQRVAILEVAPDGASSPISYGELREQLEPARQCAAARAASARGDRVAILLPQGAARADRPYGGLQARRRRPAAGRAVRRRRARLPARRCRREGAGHQRRRSCQARARSPSRCRSSTLVDLDRRRRRRRGGLGRAARRPQAPISRPSTPAADDPAMMIYTSGTTGTAEGRAARRTACCSAICRACRCRTNSCRSRATCSGRRPTGPGPAACSTCCCRRCISACPSWRASRRQVRSRGGVPADGRISAVRNAFIPPTALRMLRAVRASARALRPRACAPSRRAARALGAETLAWGREALGLTINEFYGQTECNLVLASCAAIGVARPGAIGKPVPGHEVAVIRADGSALRSRARRARSPCAGPIPVMFLGYWHNPEATAAEVHRRLDDDRRPGRRRMRTAMSASSAATTTSSPRPATASGPARSRIA